MKILALEFSSAQRSVAVLNSAAGTRSSFEVVETGQMGPFDMIEQALRETGLEREQIESVAVGLGPGSYTGIRAAIAIAQGWALASQARLLGIGSDQALAEQARAQGITGRVSVAIDAQRNEFYLETFELTAANCKTIDALRLTGADEIHSRLQRGEIVVGPEMTKLSPSGRLLFPSAATIAALAQDRTDYVSGEELSPIYLRQTSFVKAPPPRIVPGTE